MSDILNLTLGSVLGLASSATVAVTLWKVNERTALDREARELHRDLTSGVGAEARAKLSKAEYEWWNKERLPFEGRGESFHCAEASLFEAFYSVSASVDRLSIILVQYHPRRSKWGFRRSERYRRLLGWHLAIHIAWVVWFIGTASTVSGSDSEDDSISVVVPPRLLGASSRVTDAIRTVGEHKTDATLDSNRRRTIDSGLTVNKYAAQELEDWIARATGESVKDSARAARMYAQSCGLSVSIG